VDWAAEVLPNTHLWGVVFGWIACYLAGRWMGKGA
jgi:hypothetical protein